MPMQQIWRIVRALRWKYTPRSRISRIKYQLNGQIIWSRNIKTLYRQNRRIQEVRVIILTSFSWRNRITMPSSEWVMIFHSKLVHSKRFTGVAPPYLIKREPRPGIPLRLHWVRWAPCRQKRKVLAWVPWTKCITFCAIMETPTGQEFSAISWKTV